MSAPRVVVVGSINVDLVVTADRLPAAGETVAGGRFARFGGGKGANQAVAAARVGASVSFVGAVGDDEMGAEAVAGLESEGIDVRRVSRARRRPTGVALIVVDAAARTRSRSRPARTPIWCVGELELPGRGSDAPEPRGLRRRGRRRGAGRGFGRLASRAQPRARALAARRARGRCSPRTRPRPPSWPGCDDPADAAAALAEQTGAAVLITLGASGALLLEPGGAPQRLPASARRRRRHHRRRRHRQRRAGRRARRRPFVARRRPLRPHRRCAVHAPRGRPRRHADPRRGRGRIVMRAPSALACRRRPPAAAT